MSDIRLTDFERHIGSLVLSPQRKLPIHRADLGTFLLAQEVAEKPTDVGLQIACLHRIVPDATDEELRSLTPPVVSAIVQRSLTGITEAEQLLGESSGASPESGSTDSPRATGPASSAPGLPPGMG